jgi:hypothetical protein
LVVSVGGPCRRKFDPATFVFPDTGQPLQCAAAKTSNCLSPTQINGVKIIHQGGKIIWFHGASDPLPVDGTIAYFDAPTHTHCRKPVASGKWGRLRQ